MAGRKEREILDCRALPEYRLGQPEYRSVSPPDWIQIIIQKCGLSQDVEACLAKQLEQFEQYTIDWVRAQVMVNAGEAESWDEASTLLKARRDLAEKEYAEKYHPERK